ncbi:nuclease domain-containing protein [Thalassobius sp. S69A]|uniref:nuclease domain-containing protein n=2 Tax=Thalassovita TaxID=335927 RepID=UPI003C7ED2FD
MATTLPKRPIYRKGQRPEKSVPIRQAARGRDCSLQIPGICTHDPERTVGCHLRLFGFGGMGVKPDDLFVIDACDQCHAVLDSRDKWASAPIGYEDILRALMVTQARSRADGLILLKGEKE